MPFEKNPQLSLFEDNIKPDGLVRITGKALTKSQLRFNSLVNDIRKLSEELEILKVELPKAFGEFLEMVKPLEEKLLETYSQLIKEVDEYFREMKLTKKQKEVVQEYILFRIRELPQEPNTEMKAIYNRYSDMPFDEEVETARQMVNERMTVVMEEIYGVKIDFDFDPNLSEAENAARLRQQMQEKYGENFEETVFADNSDGAKAARPKSKKQLQKEKAEAARQQTEDSLRKKSFKAIYMDLMKAFHPDTETDPEQKAEKEEISKKITAAYGNQDFFTLLKLEAEFLMQHEDRIQSLPEDQLSYYLKMLTNQKGELKEQLDELTDRFAVVYNGIFRSKKTAQEFYKSHKKSIEAVGKDIEMRSKLLRRKDPADRKMIVDGMLNEIDEAMSDSIFDM